MQINAFLKLEGERDMENKELIDLFGTVLIGIACPFALLIDKNPIISRENAGGEEVGK